MKPSYQSILLFVLLIIAFIFFYQIITTNPPDGREISQSAFWEELKKNNVFIVTVRDDLIAGELIDGKPSRFKTRISDTDNLLLELKKHRIPVRFEGKDDNPYWQSALSSWLPMVLLFAVFIILSSRLLYRLRK